MKTYKWMVLLAVAGAAFGCQMFKQYEPKKVSISTKDYSYAWWLNGRRKHKKNKSDDLLCFESGYYGFMLNIDKLNKPRYGLFNDNVDQIQSLELGPSRMKNLPLADLDISVEEGGKIYRMVSCRAAKTKDYSGLAAVRMWEAGMVAQHFDIQDVEFADADGNLLGCSAKLDLVAWPESLTVNLEISPEMIYKNGPGPGIVGGGLCIVDKSVDIPHKPELEPEQLSVEMWYMCPEKMIPGVSWLLCKNKNEWEPGNYGFNYFANSVHATMNVADGQMKQTQLRQPGFLTKGKWHHLVLTYDGKAMEFFWDGGRAGRAEVGKARVKGKGLMRIGARADGIYGVMGGLYDQIRVWNRPLTVAEIQAHTKEPGKIVNRKGLVFEENFDKGKKADIPVWKDAEVRIRLKNKDQKFYLDKIVKGSWEMGKKKTFSLNCNATGKPVENKDISMQLSINKQKFPVKFDKERNCYVSEVRKFKRDWKPGYGALRDYDEFDIVIDNKGRQEENIPFNLLFYGPGSITGLCPVLGDKNGVPTGIFVQLSKNWHYVPWGGYFFPYMLLPAKPGKTEYKLRVVYGWYGKVPSASHAQLALVGYGGNGRWDQLALGAWGESICFDPDMSLTDGFVTDIRGLMWRSGLKGNKWRWTEGGWGADWLRVFDKKGDKLLFNDPKVAYLAHGPCLSDVIYDGYMGADREVDLRGRIMLPRTDDYCRTFQDLKYKFLKPVSTKNSCFFRTGRGDGGALTFHPLTKVAYGNEKGVIADITVPANAKTGDKLADHLTLKGKGPWWVSFPDSLPSNHKNAPGPTGTRAVIIRSYKAILNGKTYTKPILSLPVVHVGKDGVKCVDAVFVPPKGIKEFKTGDTVELDVEFITLPRIGDDYYGPNEAFRKHMNKNPKSWKTVYREAKGNDLKVKVSGGKLLKKYPIIIKADAPEIKVDITGGVGYVPIRFDGLKSKDFALYQIVNGKEKKLDQTAHGNDFWQTDYDPITNSFKMTFNIPLDNVPKSSWVLKVGKR